MKLIQPDGNIYLNDINNNPVLIAQIKYGITYGANGDKLSTIPRLIIYPGHNDLQDFFVFYNENKTPFTHIQSRETNPTLKKIYLSLLTDETKCTCTDFLGDIITYYFIAKCGYNLPDFVEIPDSLFID